MSSFSLVESKAKGTLPDECRNIIKQNSAKGMFDISEITDGKQEATTLYMLMTQDCNLNCPYCYQPKEFRQSNRKMSPKIVDDTVKFAVENWEDTKIKFSLFGGEPFMNFETMKYMVDKYPMFRYTVTTNGLILHENEEIREWVKSKKGILQVSISIAALKTKLNQPNLESFRSLIELVKYQGGDMHYVVNTPDDVAYKDIVYLYEQGVPTVRVSATRHSETIKEKIPEYQTLFKRIADYLYFGEKPMFRRSTWDGCFKNNFYKKAMGMPLYDLPPTFCGCGYLYIGINDKGEMYPCDFFANYPEFKMGDIYTGFNETCSFFKKMNEWIETLYVDCKDCKICEDSDIRLCPRAMCLAENYTVTGNPLKPAPNHCYNNEIEADLYKYIVKKAIETKIDKAYASF